MQKAPKVENVAEVAAPKQEIAAAVQVEAPGISQDLALKMQELSQKLQSQRKDMKAPESYAKKAQLSEIRLTKKTIKLHEQISQFDVSQDG